jgi:hypothetical protein
MAAAFIQATVGLTVPPGPLQQFTSRRDFAEFYSSSFPIFALGSEISKLDLKEAADEINDQACTELGFDIAELAEMGYAAAVPQAWQLHERAPPEAVRWYHEEFKKIGTSTTDDPQWYPLGFLGIASKDWKKTGVVLVFYDAGPGSKDITVKAFEVNPNQIGPVLISFRQGDDDYDNVERHSKLE